jgi:hypothetical protein
MSKQVINIGTTPGDHTGDELRDGLIKANSNFDELYASIASPTILLNQTGSFSQGIAAKTWLEKLVIVPQLGSPSIKIGTTSGGNEIIDTTVVGSFLPVLIQQYYASLTTLYFTVSGGNANIRFDQTLQFYL